MWLYGHVSKGKCHGFLGWKAWWLRGFRGTLASDKPILVGWPLWQLRYRAGSWPYFHGIQFGITWCIFLGCVANLWANWNGVSMLMRRYDFLKRWNSLVHAFPHLFLEGQSYVNPELPGNYSSILKWSISALPLGDPGSMNGATKSMVSWYGTPCSNWDSQKKTNENWILAFFPWWWWFTVLLLLFATHAFLWFPIWIADATELDPRQWLSKHGPFEGCKDPTCSKAALLVGGW